MSEKLTPAPIAPAIEYPDHHATAASVRERDIVTVDTFDRGHRPEWTTSDGLRSSGGEFLSYYEMEQIAANRNQITDNPPNQEDPAPAPPDPGEDPAPTPPLAPTPPPAPRPRPAPAPAPAPRPAPAPAPPRPLPSPRPRRPAPEKPEPQVPIGPARTRPKVTTRRPRGPAEDGADRVIADPTYDPDKDTTISDSRRAFQNARKARKAAIKKNTDAKSAVVAAANIVDPQDADDVDVLIRVPWLQNKLLRSKWLSGLAMRRYKNDSFTLLEYHSGNRAANQDLARGFNMTRRFPFVHRTRNYPYPRAYRTPIDYDPSDPRHLRGDRRLDRFVVKETKKGMILPHTINAEDRGRKRLPDARKASRTDRKRRDALVVALNGQDSWAGGLQNQGRDRIAVGDDRALGTIGFDARSFPRARGRDRFSEATLNFFGIDRRLRPNTAARALERRLESGGAADIRDKAIRIGARSIFMRMRAAGFGPALAARPPVAPPHPHDRRTARWNGWGEDGHRHMDRTRLPENDRSRLVRPYRYRGF